MQLRTCPYYEFGLKLRTKRPNETLLTIFPEPQFRVGILCNSLNMNSLVQFWWTGSAALGAGMAIALSVQGTQEELCL